MIQLLLAHLSAMSGQRLIKVPFMCSRISEAFGSKRQKSLLLTDWLEQDLVGALRSMEMRLSSVRTLTPSEQTLIKARRTFSQELTARLRLTSTATAAPTSLCSGPRHRPTGIFSCPELIVSRISLWVRPGTRSLPLTLTAIRERIQLSFVMAPGNSS